MNNQDMWGENEIDLILDSKDDFKGKLFLGSLKGAKDLKLLNRMKI